MRITLCGSTRFKKEYQEANERLTLMGHTVYTVTMFNRATPEEAAQGKYEGVTKEQKDMLDLVHLDKILNSDAIYVVSDETGYIGDSTRREICWARMHNKSIFSGDDKLANHSIHLLPWAVL